MTSRRTIARLVVTAVASVGAACGGGGTSRGNGDGSASSVQRLSIATGGTGGVYYPYGGGIAQVLTKHLPHVEATAEVTAASVDNIKFLKQGTSDIAFTMADTAQDAVAGREAFSDYGAVPVRALAVLYSNYMHLVTRAESGISKVGDLRGKVVSIGTPGGGGTVQAERILAAAGIDSKRDLRPQYLGVAQAVDALKDGKLDALFWSGGVPTAAILDLVNTPGVTSRLLPLDDVLPALRQTYGTSLYYPAVVPKDVYKMAADVPVVAVANMLIVAESMSDQMAYDVTRTIFDQQATLAGVHPQARELAVEKALTGATIPFHPGAIRYYRERGVWTQ